MRTRWTTSCRGRSGRRCRCSRVVWANYYVVIFASMACKTGRERSDKTRAPACCALRGGASIVSGAARCTNSFVYSTKQRFGNACDSCSRSVASKPSCRPAHSARQPCTLTSLIAKTARNTSHVRCKLRPRRRATRDRCGQRARPLRGTRASARADVADRRGRRRAARSASCWRQLRAAGEGPLARRPRPTHKVHPRTAIGFAF